TGGAGGSAGSTGAGWAPAWVAGSQRGAAEERVQGRDFDYLHNSHIDEANASRYMAILFGCGSAHDQRDAEG
ncbi:hypothetical protein, partial [Mycolicibacterium vanbaalenii]|uniref:hypothetical protein n=1 Tax=Mycolicibacterium vanbaalenii TaxID=110539 RepID=UPI0021F371B0